MPLSSRLLTGIVYLWMSLSPFDLTAQSQFKYEKLTTEDGLSSNSVTYIFEDSYGFIWISTMNGLNRYDGYEFKQYLPVLDDSTSISGSWTTFVYEDSDRNLWIGTYSNGLNLFDRKTETFRRFVHHPGDSTSISDNSFVGFDLMLRDHTGTFWVGTDNGLNQFDKSNFTFREIPIGKEAISNLPTTGRLRDRMDERATKRIRGLFEDSRKNLWVGTDWGGLFRYDFETKKFVGYFPDPNDHESIAFTTPGDFIEDDAGNLWILNYWNGIDKLDLSTGKFQQFPNDPSDPNSLAAKRALSDFIWDKDLLWIGTSDGLCTFDTKHYVVQSVSPSNKDFEGFTSPKLKDKQGNLWFSNDKGILVVNDVRHGFVNYTHEQDNSKSISSNAGCLGVDAKGFVYVLTELGVDVLNEKKERIKTLNLNPGKQQPTSYQTPNCFLEDPNQKLFFAGFRAYTLSPNGQYLDDVYPIPDNPSFGFTADLYMDKSHNLWFGGYALSVYDSTQQKFNRYYPNGEGSFALNTIYSMLEVGPDQLLIGGVWDGLLLFDLRERKFVKRYPIGEMNTLDGTTVQTNKIFKSQDNTIWVGTNYGLSSFDIKDGTFRHFGPKDGLPSNTVYCILEDDHQNLWLSTSNGLSKFDPKKETFRNYDFRDGIQGNEFYYTHAAIKNPVTRELWFAGPKGITVFHPDSLNENTYVPPVIFTKLIYYNHNKNNGQAIIDNTVYNKQVSRFSYNDNIIEYHFAALNYVSPEKNTYAYRLSGFNDDWVNLGTRREVSFTNLNPGQYTLHVKAANNDGVWNEKGASITIIILPPWWRTWWAYGLYGIAFLFLMWRLHLYQRAHTLRIERERTQRRELEQAKAIEKAYADLKATQAQLIQSEKMASLGELTAGIAHEIQNPLNFVNNFSELNSELIAEMKQDLENEKLEDAKVIADNIDENEQKIIFHGKRADAIVKGMLQHSRTSSGVKEPTDINALADEYLRLAYHGLRAKDKTFNATMKTDFDPNIGLVNMIPQDIGRVILNLITNAFYAVSSLPAPKSPEGDFITPNGVYQPTVIVSTKQLKSPLGDLGAGSWVEIKVNDNGPGIPDSIKDKIFQPFFTTKPTGQGTGLGLSLSYDIIKAHGGDIRVETKEGEGTTFIVILPA